MARLTSVGFELNSLTSGVEIDAASAVGTSIVSSPFASGGLALRLLEPASSSNQRLSFASTNQTAKFLARTYFRLHVAPNTAKSRVFCFADVASAAKVGIRLNTDRTLILYNEEDGAQVGSASAALVLYTDYCVEISIDATTIGSTLVEAKLNGSVFASGTIDITSGVARLLFGSGGSDTTLDCYFDHIAINDISGATENSYPGEGYQVILHPSAAGDNNALDAASANNYQAVDEVTPDDVTTILTSVSDSVNDTDDYNIANTPADLDSDDLVKVVSVGCRFAGGGASSNDTFVVRLKPSSGGSVVESSGITPASTSYVTNASGTIKTYPLISALSWNKASLDTAQIGWKKSADSTNGALLTAIWLMVEYRKTVPSGTSIFGDEGLVA